MNLLAIETTTDFCSAALVSDGCWFEDTRLVPRLHNRNVLAMIDNLIGAAGVPKNELDIVAFGAGPGAFTGVRIAAALAQGIGFATGCRAIAVPSSAVAAELGRRLGERRGRVTVARPCRPGWNHASVYELSDSGVRCLVFDEVVANEGHESADVLETSRLVPSARLVGELALDRLDESVEAHGAVPYYVEGDSPWRPAGVEP